jgi:ribosomal protein L11 methyltransferase
LNYSIVHLHIPQPEFADIFLTEMLDLGFDSFEETPDGLAAYINTHLLDATALDQLIEQYASLTDVRLVSIEPLANKNWNELWESNFQPVFVDDKIVIKAPFHVIEQTYPYTITIEPKMAFGTGHHETTYMMLHALIDMPLENKSVLDFGCGTGILAIFAKMRHCAYTVAIDYDPLSTQNTLENMDVNGIANIDVLLGDATVIPQNKHFDVVLANITRNVILDSFATLYNSLAPNGVILFSGILEDDIDMIKQTAEQYQLQYQNQQVRGNWAFLAFKKSEVVR